MYTKKKIIIQQQDKHLHIMNDLLMKNLYALLMIYLKKKILIVMDLLVIKNLNVLLKAIPIRKDNLIKTSSSVFF